MLLKFTAPDMLNTSLVDIATGEHAYTIVTELCDLSEAALLVEESSATSLSTSESPAAMASSSQSPTPTMASSSPAFVKQSPHESVEVPTGEMRRTTITDALGAVVADITWNGRRPSITICDEKVGALTDLFGSSTVRFMPKILAIPTRFDTEYIWTATADSLTLFDYDAEVVRGSFHQNVIRIPTGSKKLSSPSRSKISSPSKSTLLSSALSLSSSGSDLDIKTPTSTFIPTHLPGIGSNYLEFEPHPLSHDVEVVLSFLLMEILRRGRFNLTPYTFEKPKLWQLKEARDLFMRRLRRNTV